MIHKNTKTLSKNLYGTKNDMDPSIFLIALTKGYSSLVCKMHGIFTQTETNFNEQIIPKLKKKHLGDNHSFRTLK